MGKTKDLLDGVTGRHWYGGHEPRSGANGKSRSETLRRPPDSFFPDPMVWKVDTQRLNGQQLFLHVSGKGIFVDKVELTISHD